MLYKCKKFNGPSLFVLNAKDKNEAIELAHELFGEDKFYLSLIPCAYIMHIGLNVETYPTELELIEGNENVAPSKAISNEGAQAHYQKDAH